MAYSDESYKLNLANREKRKTEHRQADTPIKDIRLYFTYEVPPEFLYLYNFTNVIRRILSQKQFLTPGYSHIYISIGEDEQEAIAAVIDLADWFRYGVAVLPKEELINTPVDKLEALLLNVIANGLHDLAELDKLDTSKIDEAIQLAAQWGIAQEQVLQQNENRRYLFRITRKAIAGKKVEEIFFALIDREGQQEYKWKFGEVSLWDAAPWLHKINVTNKEIRIRPAPHMDLVLKGKKMNLELSVEKIKDGTGQIQLEDTSVPVDPKMIELETKISITQEALETELMAMIFAAGMGTRFKPWTDNHPKALAVINGKSLLQRNVEFLQQYGIKYLVVNVHHFPEQVQQAIKTNKGWGSHILISDESGELLETGGGLKKAWGLLSQKTIVLINSDILTDLDLGKMITSHKKTNALATLAVTNRETSRYFLFNEQNILCGWRNTKTGEEKISRPSKTYIQKAFSGIHVINRDLIALIKRKGKFSMVDVYLDLAKDYEIVGFDHSGGKFIDVGKPEAVEVAERMFE